MPPLLLAILSAVLVAGIMVAGCTEQAGTGLSPSGTPSPQGDRVPETNRTMAGQPGEMSGNATGGGRLSGPGNDQLLVSGQNMTPGQAGPAVNGTRPSGPPGEGRGGFPMNGTQPVAPPAGAPPGGSMAINGTHQMPPSGPGGVPPGQ